jgi:hypothetical protein
MNHNIKVVCRSYTVWAAMPAKVIRKGRFLRLPTRLIEAISAAAKNDDERSSKCRLS